MEWLIHLADKNPTLAIVFMLLAILGGIVHVTILAVKRWGINGTKTPDNKKLFDAITGLTRMVGDIGGNHLSHLPEAEKAIDRIDNVVKDIPLISQKLDTINSTLQRIESKL